MEALPLAQAMGQLVGVQPVSDNVRELGIHLAASLADRPDLQCAALLYIDELDRAHEIAQNDPSPLGAYWHGVMHRREGDFSNAKYWFRQAAAAWPDLEGWDPLRFVDEVSRAAPDQPELVARQREEWVALCRP